MESAADQKRALLKQRLAAGGARLQPLTFPQRELFEASPVPVGDMANHICSIIEVRGLLTPADSIAALQQVVDRQEVLRLSLLPGKERPLQMIRPRGEANMVFRDVPAAQRSAAGIEELLREIFQQPFDLVQGPLYRVVALRRSTDDLMMVLSIHHAIADGWTLGVLIEDLFGGYMQRLMGSNEPLPAVPVSYSDWGAAERAAWQPAALEERARFWQQRLAGRPRLWSTPSRPSAPSGAATRTVSSIDAKVGAAARDLARRRGTTLFNTLLTAFQAALSRWTGAHDIVVGSPVANRTKLNVRETMGSFAGIVPLRHEVDGGRPFADALAQVHQTSMDCFAHAMPFVELAHALGDRAQPGYNPIFEVRFALQNHPLPDVTLPNLSARMRMRSTGTARFDLGCEITEYGEALEVVWLRRSSLFGEKEIGELDRLFQAVLSAACQSPETRISALA